MTPLRLAYNHAAPERKKRSGREPNAKSTHYDFREQRIADIKKIKRQYVDSPKRTYKGKSR